MIHKVTEIREMLQSDDNGRNMRVVTSRFDKN